MTSAAMKMAGAIAAGYLLGRTRKMKLALGVGTWIVARNLNGSDLIERVKSSDVTRSLVSKPLTARMERLADAMQERTAGMRAEGASSAGDQEQVPDAGSEGQEPRADERGATAPTGTSSRA
jgi:hypothetical protein